MMLLIATESVRELQCRPKYSRLVLFCSSMARTEPNRGKPTGTLPAAGISCLCLCLRLRLCLCLCLCVCCTWNKERDPNSNFQTPSRINLALAFCTNAAPIRRQEKELSFACFFFFLCSPT